MSALVSRSVSARRFSTRSVAALAALLMAGTAWPALAQDAATDATAQDAGQSDIGQTDSAAQAAVAEPAPAANEIVVTGYRKSLESSTNAKRNSAGFTDTIFAEDIGKFPDTNIAESLNRVPGVTITRDTTGEGVNISIRGLGTNFTKVLLNGAPVAIASTGRTDSQNANREVDLDLFPTELFTQLTVSKTPTADMLEGGAAGTVNLRSARPFDRPGTHVTWSAQTTKGEDADKWGYRGSVLASTTHGDVGLLLGVAANRTFTRTRGFETIGWTNPGLTAAQCGAAPATCNTTGGNGFTIPGTVPSNAGNGLTPGETIDQAWLLAHNPGASISQIANGLIPRLGRDSDEYGRRDRINAIASFEWHASDNLHFYVDGMYGHKKNDLTRIDMDWVGRNGAAIPTNTTYDRDDCSAGCVVTGGTYANSQFFLEYRPFIETTDYWGVNPGAEWQISDKLKVDLQANYTRSTFHRESPTVLVITQPNSGLTVDYQNNGGTPSITSNVDLNNPANFGWAGGRVNIQDERRRTETKGVRGNLTWGDDQFNLKFGAAYDDVSRRIQAFDNSQAWQNAVCGNNPNVFLPSPNSQPACEGLNAPGAAPAGYPSYPGYGTGYTAGATGPVTYGGSLIPQSALAGYLMPGPDGFITVDWNRFKAASNYDFFHNNAPETGQANTGANGGFIREKTVGLYAEANGDTFINDMRLRYNAGVRWVHTDQQISGRVSTPDPRNNQGTNVCPLPDKSLDGACYPNLTSEQDAFHGYDNWLPSASAALSVTEHAIVRASASRTMTRPDPSAQLPGLNFSSPSADVGTLGNSALSPYLSTNFDLGFEYYTGAEGYVGFAAFRKALTGFTNTAVTSVAFGDLAQYGVTFDTLTPTQQAALAARVPAGGDVNDVSVVLQQQVNAQGTLKVNGLEMNWVQPLDFLLDRYLGLPGFGFSANLTLVDQKGSGAAPAVALGVAPVTYNITAYYEHHGVTLRMSTTFNRGSQVSTTNQNGISAAALYSDDYQQWDFSSIWDLEKITGMRGLPELTFDVVNLTKAKQRTYFQFENAEFTSYNPGRTIMVGLRGTF